MTRSEFLNKLKEALANDLSGPVIQENVNYYSGYIADEVRKGRSEEEVVAELGDPWAIARTIIESLEIQGNTQEDYEDIAVGPINNILRRLHQLQDIAA